MPIERKIQPNSTPFFESANVEVLRSITHRSLLNKWLRLYDSQKSIPRFGDYHPGLPPEEVKNIICYTVTYVDGKPRVTIDSFSTRMSEAYGMVGQGLELGDYVGPKLAPLVLPSYYESIARRLPVYTISKVEDVHGRKADYERLLLPFSDAAAVDRIMAWIEIISEEGRFEIKNLMSADDTLQSNELSAVIDRDLVYRPPGTLAKDVIEFD